MPHLPLEALRAPHSRAALACAWACALAACGDGGVAVLDAGSVTGATGPVVHDARMDQRACEDCHLKGTKGPLVGESPGHKSHALRIDTPCARCHPKEQPTQKPSSAVCLDCHQKFAVTLHGMRKMDCLECHDWRGVGYDDGGLGDAGRPPAAPRLDGGVARELRPTERRCVQCHSSGDKVQALPGAWSGGRHTSRPCVDCHKVHDKRAASEGAVLAKDCAACHPGADEQVRARVGLPRADVIIDGGGATAVATVPRWAEHADGGAPSTFALAHGVCRSCHAPHVAEEAPSLQCLSCHESKKPRLRAAKGQATGKGAHADCVACHAPHGFDAVRGNAGCAKCHAAVVKTASAHGEKHSDCKTCHDPHLQAKAANRCDQCHASVRETMAAATPSEPAAHRDCAACHPPHAGKDAARKACASCHKDVAHAPASHAHARCDQCHTPHTSSTHAAKRKCNACHEGAAKAAARALGKHRECLSCHVAHGDPAKRKQACTSCHPGAKKAIGGVHKTCESCHKPHDVSRAFATASCKTCHAEVATKTASEPSAHQRCATCHASHEPVAAHQDQCVSCHEAQAQHVLARSGKVHALCKDCHAPHAAAQSPQCKTCHEKPARAVAALTGSGKLGEAHGACASCHPIHAGDVRSQARAGQAACRNCHAPVAKAVTGFLGSAPKATSSHGVCTTCHASHGAPGRAFTCARCHEDMAKREDLHKHPKHAQCGDCHKPHAPIVRGRAVCVACHEKHRDHHPQAAECKGCHQFK